SKQLPKLLVRQPSVAYDVAHRDRVNWVMARDRQDACAISHDDMLALSRDAKADFFQCADGLKMIHARKSGHGYASTSISLTICSRPNSSTIARYSCRASRMFVNASCSFAPCEWQPGSPGTETANPSSDGSRMTLYRMSCSAWGVSLES